MSKSTRSSAQRSRPASPYEKDVVETQEELPSSEHEEDPELSFHPCQLLHPSINQASQPQLVAGMYMPYIEGPHMDWTVNDNLYHRFLKWCLKCENTLECKLVALPECQQHKKVIAWSGDCGMDQYVFWNLSPNELTLDTIWGKYEEYCKPQSNEVQARFDLLMSFRQGNHSIDKWYNTIQAQVNLAKYPLETAKVLHRDIFWIFLKDEDFVSRIISEGSVDLDKFPASKVHQLAKKLESSKATARHIKHVSGEPQMTQINLLHHQRTELPNQRYKKKRSHTKLRPGNNKPGGNDQYHGPTHYKNKGNHKQVEMTSTMVQHTIRTKATTNCQFQTDHHLQTTSLDVQSVEILPIMKDSHAQLRSSNARHATNLDILPVNVSKGNNIHNTNLDNPKYTKYKWMIYMMTQTVTHQMLVPVKIPSVYK